MWYAVTVILILIVCFLLLRLRFRAELSDRRRLLFLGIGRSGVQIDYVADVTRIRLFGITVRTLPRTDSTDESIEDSIPVTPTPISKEKVAKKKRKSVRQPLHIREWLDIGLTSVRAARKYAGDLLRAVIIEEAQAEVHGGFESPNLTGEVYGYYHALVGAVPSLETRLKYYPDWMGRSFNGSARLSLAIPMYSLFYRTGLMLIRMPIIRAYRLVREQRKGAAYAK